MVHQTNITKAKRSRSTARRTLLPRPRPMSDAERKQFRADLMKRHANTFAALARND